MRSIKGKKMRLLQNFLGIMGGAESGIRVPRTLFILLFYCFTFLPFFAFAASAQQQRRSCIRLNSASATRGASTRVALPKPTGTIHYPVVLCQFPDRSFKGSASTSQAKWESRLNGRGFSEQGAKGCVGEYFEKQSGGVFSPVFDILGAVTLPDSMAYYGGNVGGDDRRPEQMIRDACKATGADFSPYDHDGDGYIDMVMVIFAGRGENHSDEEDAIWPHMSTTSGKIGNVSLSTYACVAELGIDSDYSGHATFCHEFSHYLGLPDLYPITGNAYSIFDEWDLMDGGNYTNNGYSPPNYSAHERYICGWTDLDEHVLTEATTISGMRAIDDEFDYYVIRNDADAKDFYIVENRQQKGWDELIPGNGLLITRVNHYVMGDLFPNGSSSCDITLVAADNRTYRQSESYFGLPDRDDAGHRYYLSLAAYPYAEGDAFNNELTDTSTPAMAFSGKPITNIQMDGDGLITFDFMKSSTAISSPSAVASEPVAWFDIQGHVLPGLPQSPGIYIIRYADGTTQKITR